MIDQLFSSLSSLFGFGIVFALVGFIYWRDAIHWRYLAQTYRREWRKPVKERWGNAILYGKFPVSKSYNGILKVGIHPDGVALRINFPPIMFFCEPLFIPFKDIIGWNQTWYINAETIELQLKHAPEIKIAMPRSQVEWIKDSGGREIKLINEPSPHKDKPVIWYWILIISSVYSFVGLIFVAYLTWKNLSAS